MDLGCFFYLRREPHPHQATEGGKNSRKNLLSILALAVSAGTRRNTALAHRNSSWPGAPS